MQANYFIRQVEHGLNLRKINQERFIFVKMMTNEIKNDGN